MSLGDRETQGRRRQLFISNSFISRHLKGDIVPLKGKLPDSAGLGKP